jgi:hypothetical protein
LRMCGRAERNLGSYQASLGVLHGKDDDESNFLFLKNLNFHFVSGGGFSNFSAKSFFYIRVVLVILLKLH